MTPVRAEREALCDSLLAAGPGAPTLCDGWTVLDLAAHLVVREYRPDLAPGLVVAALRPRLDRVSAAYAAQGLPALVRRLREGPPRWSPTALPGVDTLVNLQELVVHHEDVRRAAGLAPREDTGDLAEAVWRSLPAAAGVTMRGSALPVVARSVDGRRQVLRRGPHPVVLTGAPVEILLRLYGRRSAAQVDVGGPSLSVTRFETLDTAV